MASKFDNANNKFGKSKATPADGDNFFDKNGVRYIVKGSQKPHPVLNPELTEPKYTVENLKGEWSVLTGGEIQNRFTKTDNLISPDQITNFSNLKKDLENDYSSYLYSAGNGYTEEELSGLRSRMESNHDKAMALRSEMRNALPENEKNLVGFKKGLMKRVRGIISPAPKDESPPISKETEQTLNNFLDNQAKEDATKKAKEEEPLKQSSTVEEALNQWDKHQESRPKSEPIPEDVQKKIDELNRQHQEKLNSEYDVNLKKQRNSLDEMDRYNVDESIKKNGVPKPEPKPEPVRMPKLGLEPESIAKESNVLDPSKIIHVTPRGVAHIGEVKDDFWTKALKTGFKFATNDKVMNVGKFMGKMTYLRMTNPLIYVGLEAFNSVRDALIVDAVTGKKASPMDVAKDAIGMAGFGYVMDNAMVWGAQSLARSRYGSSLAGDAVDAALKKLTGGAVVPKEGMFTVGDLVAKSMRTFIKPVDLSPLKFGAVGMAAGLLYAGLNNKKDGVRGTLFDAISGAGLVMLGHEMYTHFKKGGEEEEHKFSPKDLFSKMKGSESGYLGFEGLDEILNTKSGQEMKKAINGLLNNTKEGKYLKSINDAAVNGEWGNIADLASDRDELTQNLTRFHERLQNYFSSSNGSKTYSDFLNEAKGAQGLYGEDFKDAIFRDADKIISGHINKIKGSFKNAQDVYIENKEVIHNMLRRAGFKDSEINTLHKGMTDGITKVVKSLDDVTSKEIVDHTLQMKDVTEDGVHTKETEVKTSPKDVKKQSEDVAHNKANNETETVGNSVAHADVKADHELGQKEIASKRRTTNWKEKGKVVGLLGLGAFTVATALDIGERLDHKTDTSKQVNEEKRNQQKKAHQQRMDQWQQSYGYINMGNMVHQMFQERIGHHQMGNAKFAPNQYVIQGQTYTI